MMGKRKEGFTVEQHWEAGARLWRMQEEATRLSVDAGNAYAQHDLVVKQLKRINKAISELRNHLDNRMCTAYPEEFSTKVYYGEPQDGDDRARKDWFQEDCSQATTTLADLPQRFQATTVAELRREHDTPEGRARFRAQERQYRNGYVHGAMAAIEELNAGRGKRAIYHWAIGPLNDWRYGDCSSLIIAPPVKQR